MKKLLNLLLGKSETKPVKKIIKKPVKKANRDAITIELLNNMLVSLPRKTFVDKRFILCILLLYITGCRINELQNFNYYAVQTLIKEGTLTIYTFKNRSTRRIDISENEKLLLKSYEDLFNKFYMKIPLKLSVLSTSTGREMNNRAAINWMNKKLKLLYPDQNLNLKSHSFRIGYITNLLKNNNAQVAKSIIGHSNIETTMRYDRNVLNSKDVKNIRATLDSDTQLLKLIK
jgi:integrase